MANGALPSAYTRHLLEAAQAGQVSNNIEDTRRQSPEDRLIDMGQGYASGYREDGGGSALKFASVAPKSVIDTMIAEAGGHEGGLTAVGYTILNRSNRDGKSPSQVVKQRNQYEGYSAPGPASVKAQNDPAVRAKAERIWQAVQARSVPDPTGGGYDFRAASASKGLKAPNGTVNIGGNVFAKGNSDTQTALSAIDSMVAPNPQSRPPALAYGDAPASVRAISVRPNGQAASLADALSAKYASVTPTDPGSAPASFYSTLGLKPPAPPSLVSRPVNTVQINPTTGNPYTRQEITQQAANTEASRLRGDVTTSGRVANIPPIPSPVSHLPAPPPPPKVTINDGFGQQTDFNRANQAALLSAVKNVPVFGPIVSGAQSAANLLTTQPHPANPPAPTVYAPQRPTAAQMTAINYVPQTGAPTAAQKAALNAVPISHTAVPNQQRIGVTPSPILAFNGDQGTGIPAVAAMPPAGALPRIAPPVPHPYPIRVPTVPVRSVGPQPLTKFLPPGQKQNDTMTTIGNNVGNVLSATPAGHLYSLLTGAPNTGGGILNGLFGFGGLFGGGSAPAPTFVPPAAQTASPINDARYQQAQSDLRNSGMIDDFGMVTGSGGHSMWGSH